MCFEKAQAVNALSAAVCLTVAQRAKAVCVYDGIEPVVFTEAGFGPGVLSNLKTGNLSFTQADLERLAQVIHVTPEFLLKEGVPTEDEIEKELTAFEEGAQNEFSIAGGNKN